MTWGLGVLLVITFGVFAELGCLLWRVHQLEKRVWWLERCEEEEYIPQFSPVAGNVSAARAGVR